jgi:GNAT superfamily N-acetyltransferase
MSEKMPLQIHWFDGDREALRPLLQLAEDSETELLSYMHRGEVLVATGGDELVGQLLLTPAEEPDTLEVKNMAVAERRQGEGIGRALLMRAFEECRARGLRRITVATAAASIGNLRFYQRAGFRMLRVERDAFGPHTGYEPGMKLDGIPILDRIWLDRALR